MVFSSIIFIFYFLPAFLAIYYITGIRNAILLLGSAVFYTWGEGPYLFLLFGLVAFNQLGGFLVLRAKTKGRWWVLPILVAANLTVLGIFKYTAFIVDLIEQSTGKPITGDILQLVNSAFGKTYEKIDMPLPLGISFFTFQLVSYLIDIHRGTITPERNYIRLATYIMMFPHLVAGPIVRYAEIAEELKKRHLTTERIGLGIQYFIVGMCQKVMIANTVAIAADKAFSLPAAELSISVAWIGITAYTLQIFFDFCGYSNMAIGLAFLLGFHFPRNFNYPYASQSIGEFWRRWHMTLSYWFRDYLYIPLGGSRGGLLKTLRNIVIVFFLTGLWHGAAWTFIAWGLFHGFFLVLERLGLGTLLKFLPSVISRIYLLLVVMVGWVLFRATDFTQAKMYLGAMFGQGEGKLPGPYQLWLTPEVIAAMIAGVIYSFPVQPWVLDHLGFKRISSDTTTNDSTGVHALPTILLVVGLLISVALLAGNSLNPFLYFRF